MTELNEKALEAAFKAAAPGLRNNRWDEGIEAAIRSYLSALVQDEATVERVKAVIQEVAYCATAHPSDDDGAYVINPEEVARAALSALLRTEGK